MQPQTTSEDSKAAQKADAVLALVDGGQLDADREAVFVDLGECRAEFYGEDLSWYASCNAGHETEGGARTKPETIAKWLQKHQSHTEDWE